MNTEPSGVSAETIEGATETLIDFAIDRNDMKIILDSLPQNATMDRGKVEYEIQILKILMVGWALSFFLENRPEKTRYLESYWLKVQAFSKDLSMASSASLNREFDYFSILKERLETYLGALDRCAEKNDPAVVIGPEFAQMCEDGENAVVILAGSKMFNLVVGGVRQYLGASENSMAG